MQKTKFTLVVAQLVVFSAFVFMTTASYSSQAVTSPVIERAGKSDCVKEGSVYVGTFKTEEDAKAASLKMGFTDYCYTDGKCYGYK